MPVRLIKQYNDQAANTLYWGADQANLRAIGLADDAIELASDYAKQERVVSGTAATTSFNAATYRFTGSAPAVLTIAPSGYWAKGSVLTIIQDGTGSVTLAAGSGVTLTPAAVAAVSNSQYGVARLIKGANETWDVQAGFSIAFASEAAAAGVARGYTNKARKLLTAAQRPLSDLSAVMASPPTITDPTDGANSTLRPAQGPNGPFYSSSNAQRVTIIGGVLNVGTGAIQTVTSFGVSRVAGHASGFAFFTDAQTCDFSLANSGAPWIAYVTDPDGVRRRIAASDRALIASANANYYKIDFGSTAAGGRLVEVYTTARVFGVNAPAGYSIWAAPLPQQPKIAVIGDSFVEGLMNDTTVSLKLAMADWIAAAFGVNNPLCLGLGGTGVLATSGGTKTTFKQRIDAGDLDVSRVGEMDLVFWLGSVNDHNVSAGGQAIPAGDAAVLTAQQAGVAAAMIAQPNAIFVGVGGQFNSGSGAPASRTAAYKAGFQAAANSDPRLLWLDNTLYDSAADTGVIGADSIHPGGVFGTRHIGERLGRQALAALATIA